MIDLPPAIGQRYLFGHGQLGVLMDSLLTQIDLDRFLGAPDFASAKRMLFDIPYVPSADHGVSLEAVLDAALADAWQRAITMVPANRHATFDILWLANDAALLAFLLKRSRGFTSEIAVEPTPAHTVYDPQQLNRAANGDFTDVPKELVAFIKTLDAKTVDSPRRIDAAVARFVAREKLKRARTFGTARIESYVKHQIDLQNVRTYLRLRDAEAFREEFVSGGLLPERTFTGDIVDFGERLAGLPYGFLVHAGTKEPEWIPLEQAIRTTQVEDMKAMWNTSLGVEPIFAYLATIIEQLFLLRAILIGKRANLSPQEIKKMIPPLLTASQFGS